MAEQSSEFHAWLVAQADRDDWVGKIGHHLAVMGWDGVYASLGDRRVRDALRQAQREFAERGRPAEPERR